MTYQLCTQDSKKSGIPPFTKSTLFANFVIFIENLKFTQPLLLNFGNLILSLKSGGGRIGGSIHELYYNVRRLHTRAHENSSVQDMYENIILRAGKIVHINLPFFRPLNRSLEQRKFGSLNYHLSTKLLLIIESP